MTRKNDKTLVLKHFRQGDCNRLSPKCKSQLKELNIFKEGELSKKSVVAIFATTATDDKTYQVDHLHLEMIMGYRVKPPQGTQFRIWATKQFKEYISKGFVLDDERFKAGDSMSYFDEL
ncbi:Putative DNA-binding protein in cluster with Type I restriction-modification system [Bathymodiolus brooksi thiotrophic gill symbiont]|nr:Putative DNA-binding protein in cluster with Type I restriction-modification system [Bathymodiolus brooksi thiotrophic gill symbiont]